MATSERLLIRPESSARGQTIAQIIIGALILALAVGAGDPVIWVIGGILGLFLAVSGVRGLVARVELDDGKLVVRGMWSSYRLDAAQISEIGIGEHCGAHWSWGVLSNVPLAIAWPVVITMDVGPVRRPEALRRRSREETAALVKAMRDELGIS